MKDICLKRIRKISYVFLFSAFFLISDAKTAPEFTITKSTENFKEIRIPLHIWKQIVLTNYRPSQKSMKTDINANATIFEQSSNKTQQEPQKIDEVTLPPKNDTNILLEPIIQSHNDLTETYVQEILQTTPTKKPVHEIVLEVVIPESSENLQEDNSTQVIPEAVLAEPEVVEPLPQDAVIPQAPVADVVPAAQDAVPAVPSSPVSSPLDSVPGVVANPNDPDSVLVQTSRFPCVCSNGSCGCCATAFRQRGCANVRFLPEEFSFEMRMTMNGNLVTKRKLPISDPPPVCFTPPRAPFLDVCAQVKNIHFRDQSVHLCIDLDAGVGGLDLVTWNFNCVKFGAQGFQAGLDPETATPVNRPAQESGGLLGLFADSDGDDSDDGGFFDDLF